MENDNGTRQFPSFDKRMVYSPGEFAALFGKHQTWGYRQLYRGTIKAITQCGRIMIPRSEVDRLLNSAKEYDGKVQPQRSRPSGIRRSALQAERDGPNDRCD